MKFRGHQLTKQLFLTFLVGIMLFLPSCLEEFNEVQDADDFQYNPEIAIPLVQSKMTLKDFIDNADVGAFFEIDDNGLITLVYRKELGTLTAPALRLPNQVFEESMTLGTSDATLVPITATLSNKRNFTYELNLNNEDELDSVLIESGELEITMQSNFLADRFIHVTINSLIKNGKPLEITLNSEASQFAPTTPLAIDLSGYSLSLVDMGSPNTINYDVEIILSFNNAPVILSQQVSTEIILTDLVLSGFFGKLDQRTILAETDTLEIDIFDFSSNTTILLERPELNFIFENSFGLPLGINYESIVVKNVDESEKEGSGQIITQQNVIEAPELSQIGTAVQSTIGFNSSNSNIVELLSHAPNTLAVGYQAILNPGSDPGRFILEGNTLKVTLELKLPLVGTFSDFELGNTFGFSGTDLNDIKSYLMRFTTTNAFPFRIDLQAYWLDDAGNLLDSAFSNTTELAAPAQVSLNGDVMEPQLQRTEFTKNQEEVEQLRKATKMRILVRFSEDESAQVKESHFLEIKLGAQLF